MDLLDHMRIFVSVARLTSFSAAAKELNIALPTVSRSVSRLEEHLNATLLTRTTRKVAMTDVGQEFFKRCQRIIAGVDEAVRAVADSDVSPEGHLRVHTISEIGKRYLIPLIAQYQRSHPSVTFDLTLENRIPDLAREGFDVSIATSPLADQRLVTRNIGATYSVLCASRDYLLRNGTPKVPEDLMKHECLRPFEEPANAPDTWAFDGPYGPVNVYLPPSSFQLNSSDATVDAVCSGLGVGCIPAFVAAQYLADGRLVRVLPKYHLESQGIHVAYPEVLEVNVCVRSWIAFLGAHLPKSLAAGLHELPA